MTPKEKFRRIAAYARATHRWHVAFKMGAGDSILWPLERHERHAFERLPENLRRNLQP